MSAQTFIDKSGWGIGAWNDEPDRVEWRDEATGLPCLTLRGPLGNWCGYVAVPLTHPWYGWRYDDVDVEVHGGLTYADKCFVAPDHGGGICHTPAEGESDDVWWFGFDTAHLGDYVPGMDSMHRLVASGRYEYYSYKTLGYVQAEVAELANQLAVNAAAVVDTGEAQNAE